MNESSENEAEVNMSPTAIGIFGYLIGVLEIP